MLRCCVILLLSLTAGCTYFSGNPHVIVTSTPPGAEILVDGTATGKSTPSRIDLGGILGGDHEITLRKQGFGDEKRTVYHYTNGYGSRWIDGASDVGDLFSSPIDWTPGDFVLPFGVKWRYVPHEIHAVLYAPDQGPVSGEPAEDR